MGERRRCFRKNKSLPVAYRLQNGLFKVGSRSRDISEEGIRLAIFQKLNPGSVMDLEIRIDDKASIEATGQVVWRRDRDDVRFPFEAGIKFTKVFPPERNRIIRELLDRVSPDLNLCF